MTRIYTTKLVVLLFLLEYSALTAIGQTWIGVSSPSPLTYNISSSGSTNTSAEISVDIPGFYLDETFIDGKISQLPQLIEGHPILSRGNPDLQKLSFTLQLPANGNMEVSIELANYTEYTDIDIYPSEGNTVRDEDTDAIIKGESYTTDAFYPGELINSEQPFIVRNTRAQAFQVNPLQYNPVTKVLRFYYQITFRIANIGGQGDNPLQLNDSWVKPITGIEINNINIENTSFKSGQLPSEKGRMLIICPNNYFAAIAPLAEWRRQTGITTEIIDAGQFAGTDDIFNFVKDYYYKYGNLAYLLLVGDALQVPAHIYPYGASDNYYSYLAGNDHYPDILVGRFSAESVKDVEVQVERTLRYEKNPGTDAGWITTSTGIGSTLGPGDDGESDFEHVRNLLKVLGTTTYNKYNEFLDGSQGGADADGNPSANDISAKINQGTGVIFYAGHGSPSIMATGSITKSVIENLNNNGKYPLIWAAACENGNFNGKYCIAEAWLRATNSNGQPTGALAAVMASGSQTSFPPMEAQDKIAEIMSNPQEDMSTMGAVSIKGMMSMNDVYGSAGYATTDTWILFGDPSLRVRTAIPKTLIAEHKGTIGAGRTLFTVSCNTLKGFACISRQGNILGTAELDEGKATIYLEQPASGENLTLTITALNYLSYVATIAVIEKPENPEACLPSNHGRLQPVNSSFSWECIDGGNPDYYLFYLGTDNPPTNLINGEKLSAAKLKTQYNLEYNTKYFWKVIPVNSFGNAEGKVMDFLTVFKPDEDFEDTYKSKLLWNNGGMQEWVNDTKTFFDGRQSLRSGQISDNEFSSLLYPCNVNGCDFVSFWSKTSSDQGDKFQFLIDDTVIEEWSGITDWNFHIYKVLPGFHNLEWRYSKNINTTGGEDAAWLDDVHLPIHEATTAILPEEGSVCELSEFETSAAAENYFTINWSTDGDGFFEDYNAENAVYKPGILETANGKTELRMQVHGFDGCPVVEKVLQLEIAPLPVITLPADTIIPEGNSVQLDATIRGAMAYTWQPSGSNSALNTIDSILSVNGLKTTTITITTAQGCSASKEIRVHFLNPTLTDAYKIYPNPSNGNFTLEPLNGTAVIDRMMLVDREGRVVWQNNNTCNIIGSKQLSIAGLTGGEYYLVTGNKNGRVFNPVIIQ